MDEYIYRIDLDADYQREYIWSLKQQEDLLDSIFQDIDVPKLYLVRTKSKNKTFDFECIDGKQRMSCLLNFYNPEKDLPSPKLFMGGKKYTYQALRSEHPTIADKIDRYELSFTIYNQIDDEFIRTIFRRLQLGVRLNSGELLKTRTGTIRDFIYKEIGNKGPFFRQTNLSKKRSSIPFTLAQICINSFSYYSKGKFNRARLEDLEEFFEDFHDLNHTDPNLVRIKDVLKLMDAAFEKHGSSISSRAVAVSCYLFSEFLFSQGRADEIEDFSAFMSSLLAEIKRNLSLANRFAEPTNKVVLEEFQKYISQASVEAYSIKRRHLFLNKAFDHYLSTSGEIINN